MDGGKEGGDGQGERGGRGKKEESVTKIGDTRRGRGTGECGRKESGKQKEDDQDTQPHM